MSQIGLNLGPCHACVLGWAKSYTAKLSKDTFVEHDLEAVGAISIAWALFQVCIPQEVMQPMNEQLKEDNLPRLATCNVDPGTFFDICFLLPTYIFINARYWVFLFSG